MVNLLENKDRIKDEKNDEIKTRGAGVGTDLGGILNNEYIIKGGLTSSLLAQALIDRFINAVGTQEWDMQTKQWLNKPTLKELKDELKAKLIEQGKITELKAKITELEAERAELEDSALIDAENEKMLAVKSDLSTAIDELEKAEKTLKAFTKKVGYAVDNVKKAVETDKEKSRELKDRLTNALTELVENDEIDDLLKKIIEAEDNRIKSALDAGKNFKDVITKEKLSADDIFTPVEFDDFYSKIEKRINEEQKNLMNVAIFHELTNHVMGQRIVNTYMSEQKLPVAETGFYYSEGNLAITSKMLKGHVKSLDEIYNEGNDEIPKGLFAGVMMRFILGESSDNGPDNFLINDGNLVAIDITPGRGDRSKDFVNKEGKVLGFGYHRIINAIESGNDAAIVETLLHSSVFQGRHIDKTKFEDLIDKIKSNGDLKEQLVKEVKGVVKFFKENSANIQGQIEDFCEDINGKSLNVPDGLLEKSIASKKQIFENFDKVVKAAKEKQQDNPTPTAQEGGKEPMDSTTPPAKELNYTTKEAFKEVPEVSKSSLSS